MSQPLRVEVAGKILQCKQCDAEVFFRESVTLDRLFMRGLIHAQGWSGRHANVYLCGQCGFMHFFVMSTDYGAHRLTETEQPTERIECLACGELITAEDSSCPSCGWAWDSERNVGSDGLGNIDS
jgi:predicted RNA-binding Zn-ribbon protein involved in translation (DUF1610 family)